MDRRTLLTMVAAVPIAGSRGVSPAGAEEVGRPTLVVDSIGPGAWRIRSWQWQGNAWHPLIARATRSDAGIEITGDIAAADRADVMARLRG